MVPKKSVWIDKSASYVIISYLKDPISVNIRKPGQDAKLSVKTLTLDQKPRKILALDIALNIATRFGKKSVALLLQGLTINALAIETYVWQWKNAE